MHIHAPKSGFWRFDPISGQRFHHDHQKAPPYAETHYAIVKVGPPVFAQLTVLPNAPKSYALQILWMGQTPSKLPLHVWTAGPPSSCFLLAHPSPHPKRQLDQFSRFCRAHDRQTDTPTDIARYSVCNNRPHLYIVLLCGLKYWDTVTNNGHLT